jgi:hypothetical protein
MKCKTCGERSGSLFNGECFTCSKHTKPTTHAADIETVREALTKVDAYRGYEWLEMGSQRERDIASSVRSALAAMDRLEADAMMKQQE